MEDNNPDGGQLIDQFALEDRLSKIRSQINSKLENQKHHAVILAAVEENIDEQKNEKTAVAYFVSFLSLLEQAISGDDIVDKDLAVTAAYFLDIVLPFTPRPLLKSKFGDILTKLAPALTHPDSDAPLIRSTIGALESLLLSQDYQQWASNGNVAPKRAFVGLLELSFDGRPKVRRRAQEAVHNVLTNPPTSPSPLHVAAPLAADITLNKLLVLVDESKKNKKKVLKDLNTQIIHCLQLIASITTANTWPPAQIEALCDILLEVSRTSDQYLLTSAFSAFEGLFSSMSNSIDVDKFVKVLDIIFDLKPSINDTHLAGAWLAVIAKALESFASLAPELCLQKFKTFVPVISSFLGSENKGIYLSASQCLIAIITHTVPDKFLLQPTAENGVTAEIYELVDDTIEYLGEFSKKELLSIKYQRATKEILEFLTAAVYKFRSRGNPDLLEILEIVGQWRTTEAESFPHNKEAEDLIAAFISSVGPEAVLSVLPLNLTTESDGRAWLLPLLRDNVRFAELNYYKTQIVPLVDFFKGKIESSQHKESMLNKIFQTIIDQIWSLLPHFCDLPKDLRSAFDNEYATFLAGTMYSQVDLRVPICHGLRLLAESNIAYSEGAMADDMLMQQELSIEDSKLNVQYLSGVASNLLSVLFNVFSSTIPEARNYILETIDVYLQIIPKDDLTNTFNKVCGLFKNALDEEAQAPQNKSKAQQRDIPKLSITMMDLIVAMAKYVPSSSHNALFAIFAQTVNTGDVLLQKRAYRIITRLGDTEEGKAKIGSFIGEITKVLLETTEVTQPSARAVRLSAINLVLEILPATDLYFIPAIVQEIIMSTKDVNEKSRELAYQILITMGQKMNEGGEIDSSKIPGFGGESTVSPASLNEYFTMVSAGLAAQTPYMISATITALSCLIFEFKNELSQEVLVDISSTVELFLTHGSREIAKAAIGFVKVEVLSLPEDLVRANLKELLEKLMKWSHEHKGHFKSKVKHILERLVRKYGIEEVEQAIPEDDKKLIANIRKSRNKAKKKQEEGALADASAQAQPAPGDKKFMSALEEALYDSEESDDDNDEDDSKPQGKRVKQQNKQFIMESGDSPLNLLDRQALAQITSSRPKQNKYNVKEKVTEFKTNNKGKIVFSENNEDPLAEKGSGIDAYLDAVKQQPVRGQRNKLKFKRGKKAEDEEAWSDDDQPKQTLKFKSKVASNSRISKHLLKNNNKFKARKKL
ncbi:uncharacterized protein KQ657_001875 [Scheffersomyces spartinae]|uniref:Ribosomal RNA-processing protein 12-like conserved domain-containing protein n=1 Tax=Scheffersomyces spartinae TaxID=45513 RepID=A0A9P7V6V5_9ASCO|nr:uncharacterized protein KQ657_001875 [Scheffersomyces spartinae]KAG7192474.1 hypothetical protein KQ657_001875 [Scheffersomyces spartinae]